MRSQIARHEAAPSDPPPGAGPPTSLGRSNEAWEEILRGGALEPREGALDELRDYLRGALARSFAGSTSVQDADLDDFVQDALVRILGSLDSFRGDSRFTTWATAIALRTAYSALRRRRSAHISLDQIDESVVDAPWGRTSSHIGPDLEVERDDVIEALRTAVVERLTRKQRTVILAELRGVASERTADLLGTNRNAVYKMYYDARKKLRRALTEAGHGVEQVAELLEQLR